MEATFTEWKFCESILIKQLAGIYCCSSVIKVEYFLDAAKPVYSRHLRFLQKGVRYIEFWIF